MEYAHCVWTMIFTFHVVLYHIQVRQQVNVSTSCLPGTP